MAVLIGVFIADIPINRNYVIIMDIDRDAVFGGGAIFSADEYDGLKEKLK